MKVKIIGEVSKASHKFRNSKTKDLVKLFQQSYRLTKINIIGVSYYYDTEVNKLFNSFDLLDSSDLNILYYFAKLPQ